MPLKKVLKFFIFFLFFANLVLAVESGNPHLFKSGSYQTILDDHKGEPFVLVIWSKTCPSCLKDMAILKEIHQGMPRFKFVMLATDPLSDADEVGKIIEQQGLSDLDSWIFAEENEQKLRFEIDPAWYGELPRTYFFNSAHEREGISGALTHKQLISMISEIIEKGPE